MKNVFFGISAEALAEVFGISTETAALLKSESKRQGTIAELAVDLLKLVPILPIRAVKNA
ncbi:hypothetical protein F9U38_05495 [Pectobacterium versatile]|uniref:hypothetical protein n=1 Tax=Pectobacterium versatile TaxID=2488639 RepID=UPI001B39FD02|nr:hypothetical protein [Pectobacterium versatile]MBQ4779954.1 hypothetical protein [Pectobacterium versatile]MBQ4784350.1 hypothetical protein [Pectobacterium versatile]